MSEAETIEALSNITASATSFFSICISITFAYLTVAYLVGAKLSRFHLTMINMLYALCAAIAGGSALIWWDAWVKLHRRTTRVLNEVWLADNIGWTGAEYVMLGLIIIASIYLMRDVRKTSKK